MSDAVLSLPEWSVEPPVVPRGRLVRGASIDPGSLRMELVELPVAEELAERAESDGAADETDGAAALVRAMAWRAGYEAGHAEGFDAGHDAGRLAGHEAATAEALARYDEVLRRLERSAQQHLDELGAVSAAVAAQATELGFAIAEAVLARELATTSDPGADAVRRAVAQLPGRGDAIAYLHPGDVERLSVAAATLGGGRALSIVADPSVAQADCRIESGASTVDASIGSAMARVRTALGLDADRTAEDES